MRREITTLILTFLTVTSYGQQTILVNPFIDDHKVFSYNDKNLGFINLDNYDKTWQFTIEQFYSKSITVKQISDSLLFNCKDSIAFKILNSWYRLSVDTISINHHDNIYDLTIGINNIYNEDKSGVFATIYFKLILFYDHTTKNKIVKELKYLTMRKHAN